MIKQYKFRFYNFRLVFLLLSICGIGIALVGMAMSSLRSRQIMGVAMGVIIMVVLSLIDYSWLLNFQWSMYVANIVMLLAVRPQDLPQVRWIKDAEKKKDLLTVSIVCSQLISTLEEVMGEGKTARMMPNTLTKAKHGYSSLCVN